MIGKRPCVGADCGGPHEAGKSCCECEITYGVDLHEEIPFVGWARCFRLEVWVITRRPGKSIFYDSGDCSSHVACLRRESTVGYKRRKNLGVGTSERRRGSSQNRPLMRFLDEKDKMVSRTRRQLKALRER